jgi:hypothetical protein
MKQMIRTHIGNAMSIHLYAHMFLLRKYQMDCNTFGTGPYDASCLVNPIVVLNSVYSTKVLLYKKLVHDIK